MAEKEIGKVFIYFSQAGVAAVKLSGSLKVGDEIQFKGHTTDFKQKVSSMQVEKKEVKTAGKGDSVGIKVSNRVRPNDKVLLVK